MLARPVERLCGLSSEVNKLNQMVKEKSETLIVLRQNGESPFMIQDERRGKGLSGTK